MDLGYLGLHTTDQSKEAAPITLDSNSSYLTRIIEDEPTLQTKVIPLVNNSVSTQC